MAYEDLRQYLEVLESRNLLRWVKTEVDKDWEIASVARLAFRTTSPERRTALGFSRVVGYSIPVVLGTVGASRAVYSAALETEPTVQSVIEAWSNAHQNPVPPLTVDGGPCQEVVLKGDRADLGIFPIPTWTPGRDPAPFLTSACLITRDLETGIRNVGVYRMEVKGPLRTGILWDLPSQHGALHYRKYQEKGIAMPMAVAVGVDPTILMAAASKAPVGTDEFAVAGGLRRAPVVLTRCLTLDLEVPAGAEIVLEGEVPPDILEREGPFGEYTGYMGGPYQMPLFEIKCITHRLKPIYQAFFSQMPPSESSLLRQIAEEANVYRHLVLNLKIPGIVDIHCPESGSSYAILWIRMKSMYPGHSKQVLSASWTHHPAFAKWVIVTDEDVDIRDPFMREWALAWRVEPSQDIFTIPNTSSLLLDPSAGPREAPLWERRSSKICVDATKKWAYPEVAVPPDEFLNRAKERWSEYGLEWPGTDPPARGLK